MLRPPSPLTGNEWAEARRQVPVGTSPEPGPWRSKPYQRAVLDAITDPAVESVVYIAASQGGAKTELLLNTVGYYIDHEPSPILLVEPNVEMAEALSKDRLAPMIRSSPALAGKVADARTRDSGNTIRHKEFPGGHCTLVGANSAAGLAMRPIRVVLFDEIDRYPSSAGTEGDPVTLAETRTVAFWNARKVYATSPGLGGGRSWQLWAASTQCEWKVPCGDCGFEQALRWAQVSWEKDAGGELLPGTAVYSCERCGSAWDDAARWRASAAGHYEAAHEGRSRRGYRISALAVIGRRLAPMVEQWHHAQGNPALLQVFINTVLAEWWEEQYEVVDETGLLARREALSEVGGRVAIPAPVALLTAGADVQDDRIEISVYGFGAGEESWCLRHEVLYGDPAGDALWQDLDTFLLSPWPRAAGGFDYLRATAVDTGGHHTQAAYAFCGPRFRRMTPDGGRAFVFACKGTAGAGELWPRRPSKATTAAILWPIRVDVGKEQIYGRLQIAEPGPGYVHFPLELDARFFEGLTAEKIVTRTDKKGFPKRTWKLRREGLRNEPLDCAVLAYAALCGLRANGFDLEAEVELIPRRQAFVPVTAEQTQVAPSTPEASVGSQGHPYRERRERWIEPRRDWLRG